MPLAAVGERRRRRPQLKRWTGRAQGDAVDQKQQHQLTQADGTIIERVLDLLSPRWTTAVLVELSQGRKRTTGLLKALPGLSAKTLSERLRRLQDAGLISRQVFAEVPPRVEYELKTAGVHVIRALDILKELGDLCDQTQNRQRLSGE